MADRSDLSDALREVLSLLDGVRFVIPSDERERIESTRQRLVSSLRDYLIPRVDAAGPRPLVAVVAGPAGAGKSTIINALAGERISPAGMTRPTTRHLVLWAHRESADPNWGAFLGRLQETAHEGTDVVVTDDELTRQVTLIDTPPLEQPRAGSVPLAEALLGVCDICIFVTSASRYADAAPYEFLATATQAGVPILYLLNKLPLDPTPSAELVQDFAARLSRRDLLLRPDPSLIFPVPFDPVDRPHGRLQPAAVQALRDELGSLADEDFRDQIMRQSVEATVEGLVEDATGVASALGAEVEAAMALDAALSQGYASELARLEHDLMGGEFTSLARHKTWTDAAAELAGIVTRRAGVAAAATAEAWERTAGGARLLELGGAGLRRHGGEAPFDAVEVIEQWELKARTDAVERARISVGARRVIARWLWRAVLDPALDTPAAVRRRLRDVDDVVAQARGGLVGAFDQALSADAARFSELLAAVPPVSRVSQLEAAIDDVRGALAPNPGIAIDVRETADV